MRCPQGKVFASLLVASTALILQACNSDSGPGDDGGDKWTWNRSNHAFQITASTPDQPRQYSGATAHIRGKVSWVPLNSKPGSQAPSNLPAALAKDKLSLHFYFPDTSTEVTQQVTVDSSLNFDFVTPVLNAGDLNLFSAQVSHIKPRVTAAQKKVAILQKRQAAAQQRLAWLQSRRQTPAVQSQIAKTQAELQEIQNGLNEANTDLASPPEIIAQNDLPLMVDNLISAPGLNMSVMDTYLMRVASTPGASINGQSVAFSWSISNLRLPDPDNMRSANDANDSVVWLPEYYDSGVPVRPLPPQTIPAGQTVSYSFSKILQADAAFALNLTRWQAATRKEPAQPGKIFLSLPWRQPVVVDTVSPAWLAGSTPDNAHPSVQNPQPIFAQIQDSSGGIDANSIQATLSGTPVGGSPLSTDLTDQLQIAGSNGGRTYTISGTFPELAEGTYTFSLAGRDQAGNQPSPNPLQSTFRVDRTAPLLTLSATPASTSQASFSFTVSVEDLSPIHTVVQKSGLVIQESTQTQFGFETILSEGSNSFSVVSVDAAGNSTERAVNVVLDTVAPRISLGLQDPIAVRTPALSLPISIEDASSTTITVFVNGTQVASGAGPSFSPSLQLAQGLNQIEVHASDAAGNVAAPAKLQNVVLDSIAPVIQLGAQDHQLLTNPAFSLPVTVMDSSATTTHVKHNGVEVASNSLSSFTVPISLYEGVNVLEVTSSDSVGNEAAPAILFDIALDSTAPALSDVLPAPGSLLASLSIELSGRSAEPLSGARVNGTTLLLSSDRRSFSGLYIAQTEGALNLRLEAFDLAGNVAVRDIPVQISLNVLNSNLLTVAPSLDGSHLVIFGAPGATRPGITVNASAGFFNQGSAVGGANGSFSITLNPFTTATLTATDPALGRTETATVTYGSASGTLLSGMVKDTSEQPLAGVTVKIADTSLTAVTDGAGVFAFSNPVTGDQKLIVDGSTVPPAQNGPARKFGKTVVSISIGLSQSNVIDRPIYLAPIPLLTSPEVQVASGGEVTHPDAPGVVLDIPSNTMHLPGGGASGQIAVASIPTEVATIPPPEVVEPSKLIALEPSGTTFSQPVDVALPNDLGLAPGVEAVILSMNSSTGAWEIDGTAVTSADGQSIVTKPGQGITHFSLIFAAPIAPVMRAIGSQDRPGADNFNGAVSTTISLPSYKILGKEFAPSLIYRSSWAKPSVLLTNLFDIPRQEAHVEQDTSPTQTIRHPGAIQKQVCVPKTILGFIPNGQECHTEYEDYYELLQYYVHQEMTSWYEPDYVIAQFFTEAITGAPLRFDNTPEHPIPGRATLAYGMELKDPESQQYLPSGIYPYHSSYEVHIKGMTLKTRTVTAQSAIRPPTVVVNNEQLLETKAWKAQSGNGPFCAV